MRTIVHTSQALTVKMGTFYLSDQMVEDIVGLLLAPRRINPGLGDPAAGT